MQVQSGGSSCERGGLRGAVDASAADYRHCGDPGRLHPARPRPSQRPVRPLVRGQRRTGHPKPSATPRPAWPRPVVAADDQFRLCRRRLRRPVCARHAERAAVGLLAGGLRFIPYVGAALAAVLPTLIAFAIAPAGCNRSSCWAGSSAATSSSARSSSPCCSAIDRHHAARAHHVGDLLGHAVGPYRPAAVDALTICLLVLGTHVPHLGFLQILLGDAPALAPYQQIYRRLIRKAVADASAVALAEIEEKGREQAWTMAWAAWSCWPKPTACRIAERRPDRGHRRRHRRGAGGDRRRRARRRSSGAHHRRGGGPRGARLVQLCWRTRPDRRCRCIGRGLCDAPGRPRGDEPAPRRQAFARAARGVACDPPDLLLVAPLGIGAALYAAQAHGRRQRGPHPPSRHRLRRGARAVAVDRRRRGPARLLCRRSRCAMSAGGTACRSHGSARNCSGVHLKLLPSSLV